METPMRAVFDREHFDRMTGADAALKAELADLFRGQVADWTGQLADGAAHATRRDAAHALKGSALGFGFWALADACAALEALDESEPPHAALTATRAALDQALAALNAPSP